MCGVDELICATKDGAVASFDIDSGRDRSSYGRRGSGVPSRRECSSSLVRSMVDSAREGRSLGKKKEERREKMRGKYFWRFLGF